MGYIYTPWAIGALMLVFTIYYYVIYGLETEKTIVDKTIFLILMIWYLPKLIIGPLLLLKDLLKWILKKLKINIQVPILIRYFGWIILISPIFIAIYGRLFTTNNYEIERINLVNPSIVKNDNIKIVQISDIHAGSFISKNEFDKAVDIINNEKPDFVFITGDFVHRWPSEMKLLAKSLARINSKYGVYGCLGNHDHYMSNDDHRYLKTLIRQEGVKLLVNENIFIDNEDAEFDLVAVDNSSYSIDFADFKAAFSGVDDFDEVIFLCHDPTDYYPEKVSDYPVFLTLSGHTHGGQFGWEVDDEIFGPAAIVYDKWHGLVNTPYGYININRGLGTTGPPFRVGVRPEISVITIHAQENK